MVKDHSDSEKGNPLPPHRLLLSINSKGFFYMHHPTDRITHTMAFVTPVVEHWLEREIAQWVHPMKDRSDKGKYVAVSQLLCTVVIWGKYVYNIKGIKLLNCLALLWVCLYTHSTMSKSDMICLCNDT